MLDLTTSPAPTELGVAVGDGGGFVGQAFDMEMAGGLLWLADNAGGLKALDPEGLKLLASHPGFTEGLARFGDGRWLQEVATSTKPFGPLDWMSFPRTLKRPLWPGLGLTRAPTVCMGGKPAGL